MSVFMILVKVNISPHWCTGMKYTLLLKTWTFVSSWSNLFSMLKWIQLVKTLKPSCHSGLVPKICMFVTCESQVRFCQKELYTNSFYWSYGPLIEISQFCRHVKQLHELEPNVQAYWRLSVPHVYCVVNCSVRYEISILDILLSYIFNICHGLQATRQLSSSVKLVNVQLQLR